MAHLALRQGKDVTDSRRIRRLERRQTCKWTIAVVGVNSPVVPIIRILGKSRWWCVGVVFAIVATRSDLSTLPKRISRRLYHVRTPACVVVGVGLSLFILV